MAMLVTRGYIWSLSCPGRADESGLGFGNFALGLALWTRFFVSKSHPSNIQQDFDGRYFNALNMTGKGLSPKSFAKFM